MKVSEHKQPLGAGRMDTEPAQEVAWERLEKRQWGAASRSEARHQPMQLCRDRERKGRGPQASETSRAGQLSQVTQ